MNAGLFQNSLKDDPLQQHAFLQFKPSCLTLICVFLVDFASIFPQKSDFKNAATRPRPQK